MAPVNGLLRITFTSDWIVGSGRGRAGGIDATVRRDSLGLPYVPAKTLTGMLRDGAERCATLLDRATSSGQDGQSENESSWLDWVEWLFGGQTNDGGPLQNAQLSVRPARLSPQLRDAIATHELMESLTNLKASTRVSEKTGTAEDGSLRVEERAIAGLILEAPFSIDAPDKAAEAIALALLVVASIETKRIGGNRRRGAGTCSVEVSRDGKVLELDDALAQLTSSAPTCPEPLLNQPGQFSVDSQVGQGDDWAFLKITLRTETPVVVPDRVTGNSTSSTSDLPGRVLLPAFLTAVNHDKATVQAMLDGQLVFTSATPSVRGERSLPAPMVLAAPKSVELGPGSCLTNILKGEAEAGTRLIRDRYVVFDSDSLELASTHRAIHTHASIGDDNQRPSREFGGLYSIEAIADHQEFVAEIHGPRSILDESPLKDLVGSHLRVGRSKKDDYGDVVVTNVELAVGERASFGSALSAGNGDLIVWVCSEVLLRDQWLRASVDLQVVAGELSEVLGVGISVPESGAFVGGTSGRIDGWRARWQLPHVSLIGLGPGTVLRFKTDAVPSEERMNSLLRRGIGERTAEGFGRVLIANGLLEPDKFSVRDSGNSERSRRPTANNDAGYLTKQDKDLINHLAELKLRRWVQNASARKSATLASSLPNTTRSQIGHIRAANMLLLGTETEAKEAKRRLKQLLKDKGDLAGVVNGEKKIWDVLGGDGDKPPGHMGEAPWSGAAGAVNNYALHVAISAAVHAKDDSEDQK